MAMSPIPEGYHSVSPYLNVHDAEAAIDFYKRAFGAEEVLRLDGDDGKVIHAEIRIGDSHVMLADENPVWGNLSPRTLGGASGGQMLYVEDVDSVFSMALNEGATQLMAVETQFWGDRMGQLQDPFGHRWSIASHTEDVSPEEINRRFAEWREQQLASNGGRER
jgi:PhnB protein